MATVKVPVEKTPEIIVSVNVNWLAWCKYLECSNFKQAEYYIASKQGVQEFAIGESMDEPVVTRKELWSYYCEFPVLSAPDIAMLTSAVSVLLWWQCKFQYFSDFSPIRCAQNVQSVGPLWFTLTLFQSLLYAAGFDPSQGPGQPCSSGASSDCVVPWSGGTISVSSVVLIANGISFAVSPDMVQDEQICSWINCRLWRSCLRL